jgi:hypothetical protein
MRRTLALVTALCIGTVSTVSAQARARVGARLEPQGSGLPYVRVHLSNLLDDSRWRDPFDNAYTITVHWHVELWRQGGIDRVVRTQDWDATVTYIPWVEIYNSTERTAAGKSDTTFKTLADLKSWIGQDIRLSLTQAPTPPPGKYYYVVNATVSTSNPDQADNNSAEPEWLGTLGRFLNRVISGGSNRADLPSAATATFTVRGP